MFVFWVICFLLLPCFSFLFLLFAFLHFLSELR